VQDFWDKYSKVYEIFRKLKPELMDNLKDWEELFKKELIETRKKLEYVK